MADEDLVTPAWIVVLGHLYRRRDIHEPNWTQTRYGLQTSLDLPYVTICKSIVLLKKFGYIAEDNVLVYGKQRHQGDWRRCRKGYPYLITARGIVKFEAICKEIGVNR